jgi:hypothetical protein
MAPFGKLVRESVDVHGAAAESVRRVERGYHAETEPSPHGGHLQFMRLRILRGILRSLT